MGALALAYVVQTSVLWADPSPMAPLDAPALAGGVLWHSHNCQACHQLYGYGGFLGPDLTNAATVHGAAGLRDLLAGALALGPGAMPVIPITPRQVDQLTAWLVALDGSGVGQARVAGQPSRTARFDAAVADALVPGSDPALGYAVWLDRPCRGCHQPLSEQPGGPPDLSLATARLDAPGLARVLAEGRPPRMPDPGLSATDQAAIGAWLVWLGEHREVLQAELASRPALVWSELPWWEFE